MRYLNDLMKNRQDTFAEDMKRLWEDLERANSPAGLLVANMRAMEEGTFVGKVKLDKQLAAISKKYKLDDQAESKLADTLARHSEEKRQEYYIEIDRHLETSDRPSARAMMLLKKVGSGGFSGRSGSPAAGSYAARQNEEKEKEKRE